MKKILFSLLVPALFMGLMTSCETDRDSNPTLDVSKAQEGFHLNVPANAVNNTYDLLAGEKLWITAEQPNYGGLPYMTRYFVQVSNEEAFTQFTELATSFTTAKMGVDTYEMNQAIVAMFKEKNPDLDYPNLPAPVWIRLRAIIDGYSYGESFSNIIKLPSVLANYQAPKATLPTDILIVGSSIQTAWADWKPLAPVYDSPGKFYTIAYFPAGGQFKWGLEKFDMIVLRIMTIKLVLVSMRLLATETSRLTMLAGMACSSMPRLLEITSNTHCMFILLLLTLLVMVLVRGTTPQLNGL